MFRRPTARKQGTGADKDKDKDDEPASSSRGSRVRFSKAGPVPAVARGNGKPKPSASDRAYGADRLERDASASSSRDTKDKTSASDRAFGRGSLSAFGAGFRGVHGFGPMRATADRDGDDRASGNVANEAEEILDVGSRSGRDDYDARLAALAEAMDGRSEAEQLALIQEVMRQDDGATDSWLQLSRLEALRDGRPATRGTTALPEVDGNLLDAVEESMLFTPEGMEQFVRGGVKDRMSEYQDASRDLRWFVNNHGVAMTPDGLQAAVDEFKRGRGDEWNNRLDQTQAGVIADGERILSVLNDPRMASLSAEQRRAMMETLVDPDSPAGPSALSIALNQEGGVQPELLDGAMSFFAETGLRESSPELATVVADARVQMVSRSIEEIDPADPASAAAARAEIAKLRSADYASLRGIGEDKLDELDATVDALQDTVRPNATPEQITASLQTFDQRADALDAGSEGNVSESLRLLALQSGSAQLPAESNVGAQAYDASMNMVDLVGLSADTAELMEAARLITGTGRIATALGSRALGGIMVGISAISALKALQEGDYAEAGLSALSGAVGVAALLTSSSMCAGLGLVLLAAGLGLDQWRRVQESNRYMNDEAQRFLEHSGLNPDLADCLTDQSGEGHSPVPFLFAYAAARGLDREQTVAWINGLQENQLSWIRDQAHHSLDRVNGDVTQIGATGDGDTLEFLDQYGEETRDDRVRGNHSHIFTDPRTGQMHNVVAEDWETFDAMLALIGIAPPRA